jgi:hypothetical protein
MVKKKWGEGGGIGDTSNNQKQKCTFCYCQYGSHLANTIIEHGRCTGLNPLALHICVLSKKKKKKKRN